MMNGNKMRPCSLRIAALMAVAACTLGMKAQNRLAGTLSHKGQPVPYATVTLNTDSTSASTLKGYATSNNNGEFVIDAGVRKNDWIIVRCLGYKELKKQITDTSATFNLQMEEDVQMLSGVTVEANYSGMKFSNDTLSLDTKHYTLGTEENIGEVLKKIPGMEVNETGKVSYAGRDIGKILVDGKDIVSSSGNLAVKNLPPGFMESAEVLMNYKNSGITDPFKKDETLALNIKTSGKKQMNGYIQGAAGYENKYQVKSNLIHIGGKSSFSAILSANNVGDGVFSIEDYITSIVGIDNLLGQKKNTYKLSDEENRMLAPPDNLYEHANGALSINTTYSPSGAFNFRGNIIYNGSFLKAESYSEDQYFSGNFTNSKKEQNKGKNHYISANFQETWKFGKSEVNSSTRLNLGKYGTEQTLGNHIAGKSMAAGTNKDLLSGGLVQEVNTNSMLGKGVLYTYTHVEISSRKNAYRLLTDSLLLPVTYAHEPLENEGLPFAFSNKTGNQEISVSPQIGYVFRLWKDIQLNSSLSYHHSTGKLVYSEEKAGEKTGSDFSRLNKYEASIRLEKNKGLVRFGLGAGFSINNYGGSAFGKAGKNESFLSPGLSLQFVFSPKHRLSLYASYDIKPIDIGYLSRVERVAGYSEIIKASGVENFFSKETKLSLNYSLFDLFTNTTFFLLGNYANNKNLPKPGILQKGLASTATYQDNGKQEIYSLKTYLNKGLLFIPVDAKITCSFSQTGYDLSVNGAANGIKLRSLSAGLSFLSRFKSMFNAELGAKYGYNANIMSAANVENAVNEWDTTGKLHYSYHKLKAYLYGTFFSINNPSDNQRYFDIGFSCEYRIKKTAVRLSGKNMLHLRKMEWMEINSTPYYTAASLYRKIPGYLQCSLLCNF